MTKTYKEFRPYGTLTVLLSGKRYLLCAPHPIESDGWAKEAGQQTWSVYSMYDGLNHEEMQRTATYSPELKRYMFDRPLTIIDHPVNIHIELSDNLNSILVFDRYEEEPEEAADVDLSEDENYVCPDYLMDVIPVLLDESYPINDAPYFPDDFYQIPPKTNDEFPF